LTDDDNAVRSARATDIPALDRIIRDLGLFTPDEAEGFAASLPGHFQALPPAGPIWLIAENELGAAYLAPEPQPGDWNLLFLGVLPNGRRTGVGRALVAAAESHALDRGGRTLRIDTSDRPPMAAARTLYAALGYEVIEVAPDHWGPGDTLISYRKAL
jgi:GNAT superfamily N-acetyltransferase